LIPLDFQNWHATCILSAHRNPAVICSTL
jgi:hypothetical protein